MIRKISSCKAGAAGHTALVSIPETRVKKRLPTPFIRPQSKKTENSNNSGIMLSFGFGPALG
jgi:hypothetical protein